MFKIWYLNKKNNVLLRARKIVYYATKDESKRFSPRVIFCYACAEKLYEVKSTFLPCSIQYFSPIGVEKTAFICVQWRMENWLQLH